MSIDVKNIASNIVIEPDNVEKNNVFILVKYVNHPNKFQVFRTQKKNKQTQLKKVLKDEPYEIIMESTDPNSMNLYTRFKEVIVNYKNLVQIDGNTISINGISISDLINTIETVRNKKNHLVKGILDKYIKTV